MYYTVYKTTNQVNGKFYIGTHKTVDLNDDYLGSGTLLKRAIEKYGVDNFKKEILFVFDNPEDMFAKEAEIVTEDFISENNTYNIKKGGFGGFDYVNANLSEEQIFRRNQQASKIPKERKSLGGKKTGHVNITNAHKQNKIRYDTFTGKKHSEETKKAIGLKNSVSQKRNKNSQYGTFWVTDGISNKKIKSNQDIPEGWFKGRNIQFT
jgi:group I intron endonuclease